MWILFFSTGMGGATFTLIGGATYGLITGNVPPTWTYYVALGFFCVAMAMVFGKFLHELRKVVDEN